MAGTKFSAVYNRFLETITDDMYMELTPQDTIKDLQHLLINAIPRFEFPRKNLYDYTIETALIYRTELQPGDFVISVEWGDLSEDGSEPIQRVLIEKSSFGEDLSPEEINILALIMKEGWVLRQLNSIEVTRMKYTGADFKMTSQANHLQKLLALQEEARRDEFHHQRLYRRRKYTNGYESNWSVLRNGHDKK